ncbi:MAG: acyl-[acyl-carrier-protein] thioesterase [Bacteroidales bacterium]
MRELTDTTRVQVRFSEIDPLNVVWHGNYVKYLEDAREAFGRRYGIGYKELVRNGYFAPVYDLQMRFNQSALMDDELEVNVRFKPSFSAKMVFEYEIRRPKDNALILTATSVQLFITRDLEFCPSVPDFYRVWLGRVCYDFFSIESYHATADKHEFRIRLSPDSDVYKGHFPGSPVAPGVCTVQMLKECAEYALGARTLMVKIGQCKFLKLVVPSELPEADVAMTLSKKDDACFLTATLSGSGEDYVVLKAELKIEDNG